MLMDGIRLSAFELFCTFVQVLAPVSQSSNVDGSVWDLCTTLCRRICLLYAENAIKRTAQCARRSKEHDNVVESNQN